MKKLITKTKLIATLILVLFLGCETDDALLPEIISSFTYTLDDDTGTVEFINISEKASSYMWNFGDGETSKEINPVKTYRASGTYTVSLTASNTAGASSTFEDDITIVIKAPITLPITFDDSNVNYALGTNTFNGASFEIVENPDVSGTNDKSSNVGAITNSGVAFEGIYFDLGTPVDLSENKTITMNFWADAAVDVLLKLEEGTGAATELNASHGGTGWEMMSFDFTSSDSFSRITLFVDGPGTTAGTFYLDDIVQVGTMTGGGGGSLDDCGGDLVNDFETSDDSIFNNFGGGVGTIIDNPDTAVNTSAKVGQYVKNAGEVFGGITVEVDPDIDFDSGVFSIDVYSQAVRQLLFKLEGLNIELIIPTTGAGWETITYDFSAVAGNVGSITAITLITDNGTAGDGSADWTILFDNIRLCSNENSGGGGFDSGLLTNGDFENGSTPWILGVDDAATAPVTTETGNTFYSVNVTTPDPGQPFLVNLSQKLEIVQDETYTLTFDAWSDTDRPIIAGIGLSGGSFANTTQVVNITSTRETYSIVLTATGFGASDARVLFDLNGAAGLVNIDNVSLVVGGTGGGDTTAPIITLNGDAVVDLIQNDAFTDPGATANDDVDGDISGNIVVGGDTVDTFTVGTYVITYNVSDAAGNAATEVMRTVNVTAFDDGLLTNGDFEAGSGAPWILGVDDGATAPVTTENGNTFYSVNITTPDPGQPFLVNLSQKLEIIQDATYTLTFDAWSDTDRPIIAGIGLSGGSFANTAETVNITTTRETYSLSLTATGFGAADARVLFDLNGAGGLANIDNVSLVQDTGGGGGGGGLTPLSALPADFESGEEFSAVFEPSSVSGSITANTVSGGINTSANIYTFNKPSGTEFYGGMENVFATALDMTTTRTFKVKVYSTKANAVFQFELQSRPNDGSIPNYSIQQTVVNANEWVELTFDFGAIVPGSFNPNIYNAIVIIPDFNPANNPTATTETYYIDDLILE